MVRTLSRKFLGNGTPEKEEGKVWRDLEVHAAEAFVQREVQGHTVWTKMQRGASMHVHVRAFPENAPPATGSLQLMSGNMNLPIL